MSPPSRYFPFFLLPSLIIAVVVSPPQTLKPTVTAIDARTTEVSQPLSISKIPEAPFPDGLCGGRIVTLTSAETYGSKSSFFSSIGDVLGGLANTILSPRPVEVWLPPAYDWERMEQSRFPVLYCHDGQNAISDASSWTGASWRLVGALTRLDDRNLLDGNPPIVVLLPSADGDLGPFRRRHLEYGDLGQPMADAHADKVANVIKPLIDRRFRTRPGLADTACIGTSLGGQASMNLLLRHPKVFGAAACLSPAFQPATVMAASGGGDVSGSGALLLRREGGTRTTKRIYIDIGGDVEDVKVPFLDVMDHLTTEHWWNPGYFWLDTQLRGGVDAMRFALRMAGIDHAFHVEPGGRHNERAWAQRIHLPLLHLYGRIDDNGGASHVDDRRQKQFKQQQRQEGELRP